MAGPFDLGLTGILVELLKPLKAATIPIFALSTYDTDWILVPWGQVSEAVEALRYDGLSQKRCE